MGVSVMPQAELGTNHAQGFHLVVNINKAVIHLVIVLSTNQLQNRDQD